MRLAIAAFCAAALGAWTVARADYILDGNMDALSVGTAPDNGVPAGAWAFPDSYVTAGVAETDPGQFHIAATNSFETGASGNSLRLDITDIVPNVHLPNLFTQSISEAANQIVRVKFDIWVDAGATSGGAIYVGGDEGGGGFSNGSDRGPQLMWLADETIVWTSNTGANTVVVPSYSRGAWQTVILDIDLVADNYDMYWGPRGGPLTRVGTGLTFRASTTGTLDHLDRFTYVNFGATTGEAHSAIDNVSAEVVIRSPAAPLNPGLVVSGTPADMFTSNDMYYVVRPGIVLSSAQSPIVMTLSGTAPSNMPGSLKLVYESRAQQSNIRQTIEAFNFSTNGWVQLDQRVLPTSIPDTVITSNIAQPANFVGPNNEVRARVSYKTTGPTLTYPWRVFIDEATWRFQP